MRLIPTRPIVYINDVRNMEFDFKTDLVVTSPPYWNIKDYGQDNQIGYGQLFSDYINDLSDVFSKCSKSLNPGCRMCINIGDQYLSTEKYKRFHTLSIQSYLITKIVKMGMDYMGSIVWYKVANCTSTGGAASNHLGSGLYPKNGIVSYNYEWIILFKKHGKSKRPSEENKERSRLANRQRNDWFKGIWQDIPGASQRKGHPAVFPIQIPYRLIRMFSFCGEVVLDPFVGSGTTLLAAERCGRYSIGVEQNPDFISIIQEKVPSVDIRYERQ